MVPFGNPVKLAVAVMVDLGSETAEVSVTQSLVTVGSKAFVPAKEGSTLANKNKLINSTAIPLLAMSVKISVSK